ncbi:TonB-dependent siderophore receptor [Flavobacterium sp. Sd200]|uniref:TonB-dependent receptor n=1 Tax=Flavobacterium sp. Sd200 TaxID=2692211 RepID=UPI0013719E3B|nr:TonB-dependent receptor [Flavobacterium sp. Sd200]MXN93009.1 TonB-dependent siderophore receptor [Flavobacterium sp. Sd200]
MNKLYYCLCIVFLCTQTLLAQSILSGEIKDVNNLPVPGASVKLVEKNLETFTNNNGNFQFKNIDNNTYHFIIYAIGFETKKVEFAFTGNTFTTELKEESLQLQEVEIIGRKERSYKNTNSFTGTRTETALKDVPQSISYVTKEVIEDQQAFRVGDIVKNVSGASNYSYYSDDITLRGFRTSSSLINGMKRIIGEGWKQPILANIERVDIIKGPASALFANTDPGGTVNMVTKKPLDEDRRNINFAFGSYDTYRINADFTGPMDNSKTLLYRLNLAYQDAQSFRVLQGSEDIMVAPSFSFIPDDKTQVNFDFVYTRSNGRLDRGQPIFGATAGTNLNSTPISFAIGKENDYLKETYIYFTTSVKRKITDNISLNASYMKFMAGEDLLEHRTSNRYAVDPEGNTLPTQMEMRTIVRKGKNYSDNVSLYLVSDFKTGPIEHKLLTGYDYLQNKTPVGNSNYGASGYIDGLPNVPFFDLVNPNYALTDMSGYVNVSAQIPQTKYFVNGIYAQDQIKWGKIQMLLALRHENYVDVANYNTPQSREIKQDALIPRIGLVYSVTDQINLYGTYTEGYQPQGSGIIGAPQIYGGPFDPLISSMYEAGAKAEFFNKRLSMNVALYNIEQNNILINANNPDNPDMLRQVGQQRSKGVELDAYGMILPNLSVSANFSYSEAKITESDDPDEIGSLLPNAPKLQTGIWAKYNFTIPALSGVGIGAGVNHTGERNTQSAILKLPEYTLANVALYYTVGKLKLSFNLNNVFNKTHWVGGYDYVRLFPGTPRNYMLGMSYNF